jgi:hypothetical protein
MPIRSLVGLDMGNRANYSDLPIRSRPGTFGTVPGREKGFDRAVVALGPFALTATIVASYTAVGLNGNASNGPVPGSTYRQSAVLGAAGSAINTNVGLVTVPVCGGVTG